MKKASIYIAVIGLMVAPAALVGTPIAPDSAGANKNNPFWTVRESGPTNAPVTLWPTNNGNRIKNANGQEVQFSDKIVAPSNQVKFTVPGIINGLPTTDATQKTGNPGDPVDPGTLYFSAFISGVMITDSIGGWLSDHGYVGANEIFMPDFLPAPGQGLSEIYYGVDLSVLGNSGKTFVDSHSFGNTFAISGGGISGLPYLFSSTPLSYIAGAGWVGTPLANGTQVSYTAFHAASTSIPDSSSSLALSAIGAVSVLIFRWRRARMV